MLRAWVDWGFRPSALVIEESSRERGLGNKLRRVIRQEGLRGLTSRLLSRIPTIPARRIQPVSPHGGEVVPLVDSIELCREWKVPVIRVPSFSSPAGLDVVRDLRPDVAIHAGAGILRKPLLSIPRLGTLNAHMGLLPFYRGMNVAEWAAFLGGPVGCTVHLIDPGIDTGDILCVRPIPLAGCTSVAQLRDAVNHAQLALLGEVVRYVVWSGELPPRRSQTEEEGLQFFQMHPDLAALLEANLTAHDHVGHSLASDYQRNGVQV
jgi:hypothetical protein